MLRSLLESGRGKCHVVIDLGDYSSVVQRAGRNRYRYQYHFVPVVARALILVHHRDEVTDVVECKGIVHGRTGLAVAGSIRGTIVCNLVFLEEAVQTVFLYHQDSRRYIKLIFVVVISIVESWE